MWPLNDVIRGNAVFSLRNSHEEGNMALGGYRRNGQSLRRQLDNPPR
jgi:hypothetical protein